MTDPWVSDGGNPESWGRASGPRAGFWRRFAGLIIDGVIVGIIGGILQALLRHGVGDGLSIIISAGYYSYFEGGPKGAGFGKQAMGIRVIDAETGEPIGHPRAFIRWISQILSTLIFFLGYLWMLWDPEKQCWHDKLAGDVVVPTAEYPVVAATPTY